MWERVFRNKVRNVFTGSMLPTSDSETLAINWEVKVRVQASKERLLGVLGFNPTGTGQYVFEGNPWTQIRQYVDHQITRSRPMSNLILADCAAWLEEKQFNAGREFVLEEEKFTPAMVASNINELKRALGGGAQSTDDISSRNLHRAIEVLNDRYLDRLHERKMEVDKKYLFRWAYRLLEVNPHPNDHEWRVAYAEAKQELHTLDQAGELSVKTITKVMPPGIKTIWYKRK